MSEWISVKDRLPEYNETILCYDNQKIYILVLGYMKVNIMNIGVFVKINVVHAMDVLVQ